MYYKYTHNFKSKILEGNIQNDNMYNLYDRSIGLYNFSPYDFYYPSYLQSTAIAINKINILLKTNKCIAVAIASIWKLLLI